MQDLWARPIELRGQHVVLQPLSQSHAASLAEASADGELWRLWYTTVPHPDAVAAEIDRRLGLLDAGSMVPFAICMPDGTPVGMTTYMHIDHAAQRLEIGSTWYRKSVQRGPINTECKLLMLRHAFERLDAIAVEFRTHRLNTQSRRAIERLGAQLDGILRSHMRTDDGNLRDTAVYSIIASEWPTVRSHLQWQLEKPRD